MWYPQVQRKDRRSRTGDCHMGNLEHEVPHGHYHRHPYQLCPIRTWDVLTITKVCGKHHIHNE